MIELLFFCLFHKNKKRKTGSYACMKTPQLEYDYILNTDLMKDDIWSKTRQIYIYIDRQTDR